MSTPSVHDSSTLRGWWEEDHRATQNYWNNALHKPGAAPRSLEPHIAEDILRWHLHCPSLITVIPLQDLFAIAPHLRVKVSECE